MKVSKYLIFKTVIQLFLFRKSYYLYKNEIHGFINTKKFLKIPINYSTLTNNIDRNERYKYLKKELSDGAKSFVLYQFLFDIIDFIFEFTRYRRLTTLSHHFLASFVGLLIYKFGNTGHSIPYIIVGTNQMTGVLGFNLYLYLKRMKYSNNVREYHRRFMTLLQIFIRIPILSYALNTLISFLLNERIDRKDYMLYIVQLIGGGMQFYNEIDWL